MLVTIAIAKSTQDIEEFRMKAGHTRFIRSRFSRFLDFIVDLLAALCNSFLNPGWMDTAIGNQFLERDSSHFSPHRIKTRNNN